MKVKYRIPIHNNSIAIIVVILVLIIALGLAGINIVNANNQSENLPKYGWVVCGDLGIGFVQGFGNVHRFRMCAQEVWQVMAFCLDPLRPIPTIGTICELIDSNTFWCGHNTQRLRIYEIQATSTPIPTVT